MIAAFVASSLFSCATSSTTHRSVRCGSRGRASCDLLLHDPDYTCVTGGDRPAAGHRHALARPAGRIYVVIAPIARWTLPIWLYVSVTGVLVYVLLYQPTWLL